MYHGGADSLAGFANRGQHGGHTGADIGTEGQGDTGRQADKTLCGHDDDDTGGCRGRLDQGGKAGCHQNPDKRIIHAGHQVEKRLVAAQRTHGIAHDAHAKEHQTEPHQHTAVLLDLFLFGKEQHTETARDHQQGIFCDLEGDDLGRDGGADVGPHDDADRLCHGHQAGSDKTDYQHRGDR